MSGERIGRDCARTGQGSLVDGEPLAGPACFLVPFPRYVPLVLGRGRFERGRETLAESPGGARS